MNGGETVASFPHKSRKRSFVGDTGKSYCEASANTRHVHAVSQHLDTVLLPLKIYPRRISAVS